MKIIKKYQGTVPENRIMSTKTNSDIDTYSCNYVNNLVSTPSAYCTNASGVSGTSAVWKQGKIVFLYLGVTKTLSLGQWNTLCTIPSGYRPFIDFDTFFANNTNDMPIHARISASGEVKIWPTTHSASATNSQIIIGISFMTNQ